MDKYLSQVKWKIIVPTLSRMGLDTERVRGARMSPSIRRWLRGGRNTNARNRSRVAASSERVTGFEPLSSASLAVTSYLERTGGPDDVRQFSLSHLGELRDPQVQLRALTTFSSYLKSNGPEGLQNYVDHLKCGDSEVDHILANLQIRALWKSNPVAAMSLAENLEPYRLNRLIEAQLDALSENARTQQITDVLTAVYRAFGPAKLQEVRNYFANEFHVSTEDLTRIVANILWLHDRAAGLAAFEKMLSSNNTAQFRRLLSNRYQQTGNLSRSIELLDELGDEVQPSDLRRKNLLQARLDLLNDGFSLPPPASPVERTPQTAMYLLHNSLPFASGGYATRTHGLAVSATQLGWTMRCVTRTGFPSDLDPKTVNAVRPNEMIDGVSYNRLIDNEGTYRKVNSKEYLHINAERVTALARELKPMVLHGASNHINGIAANYAGRKLGIPSVYEVRGLWELTRMSREPDFFGSEMYRQSMRLETESCQQAAHVITLTEALKSMMIEQGVAEEKITVLPNGVDAERFKPLAKDEELVETLGLKDKVVIGFIGSMPQYEGLDYLVKALSLLRKEGLRDFHFLAVGDGTELEMLKALVEDLGLRKQVTFTGRVPHASVEKYYSVIDICPFPRKGQPVCHVVSPLKPFEAMAMGKVIVASDVDALKEFVTPGMNGMLHRADDVDDLADVLKTLILDEALRRDLGTNSVEWVRQERDWSVLGTKLTAVYQRVS